jgi:hypothetical protein
MFVEVVDWLILRILCAMLCYQIAEKKGKDVNLATLVGLAFGILGVAYYTIAKSNRKSCSFCGGLMNRDAKICPHCGREPDLLAKIEE